MNKEQFEALTDEKKAIIFDEFELDGEELVHTPSKTLKEELANARTTILEKEKENEKLKAEHIKLVKNGQPMPEDEPEDQFVSLFKNIFN